MPGETPSWSARGSGLARPRPLIDPDPRWLDDVDPALPALRHVRPPRSARRLATGLVAVALLAVCVLVFLPWTQTAVGTGEVVPWAADDRTQDVGAPVKGRIRAWHVREGDRVQEGDLLLTLEDNDPDFASRLAADRSAQVQQLASLEAAVISKEAKVYAAEQARGLVIAEYDAKLDGLRRKLAADEAALATARIQAGRMDTLTGEGLASARKGELARLKLAESDAKVLARRAELGSTRNARDKAAQDADAKIAEARADLEAARAKASEARQKLLQLETKLARQANQEVRAPRDGVVWKVYGGPGGTQVKQGDTLVSFVPTAVDRAVALKLDGNDVPLVRIGDPVRLVFEGWPAIQFGGWPGLASGTFAGEVAVVDAMSDGSGAFRLLVVPTADAVWPEPGILRQGTRAKGFVLLREVRLGYELWRQINGFPPLPSVEKGDKGALPTGKKPRIPGELK